MLRKGQLVTVAPTSCGTGARAPTFTNGWARGAPWVEEQQTRNWPNWKRSPKRLIVLLEPKKWRDTTKKRRIGAPTFAPDRFPPLSNSFWCHWLVTTAVYIAYYQLEPAHVCCSKNETVYQQHYSRYSLTNDRIFNNVWRTRLGQTRQSHSSRHLVILYTCFNGSSHNELRRLFVISLPCYCDWSVIINCFLPTGLTEIGQFCDPTKPDSWIGQTHFQPWYQQKTLEPNDFHGTAVTAEYNLGLLSWPLVQNGPKSEPPRESSLNRIKKRQWG